VWRVFGGALIFFVEIFVFTSLFPYESASRADGSPTFSSREIKDLYEWPPAKLHFPQTSARKSPTARLFLRELHKRQAVMRFSKLLFPPFTTA